MWLELRRFESLGSFSEGDCVEGAEEGISRLAVVHIENKYLQTLLYRCECEN